MHSGPSKGKGKDLREIEHLHYVKYLTHIFTKPPGDSALIIPILKMRILRLRDMKKIMAPNPTTRKYQNKISNPVPVQERLHEHLFPPFPHSHKEKVPQ